MASIACKAKKIRAVYEAIYQAVKGDTTALLATRRILKQLRPDLYAMTKSTATEKRRRRAEAAKEVRVKCEGV